MITFKTEELCRQFLDDRLHRDVRLLVTALASYMEGKHDMGVVVTAVFPEPGVERVSQTHADGRAVDVRTKDWPDGAATTAETWMNANFKTGAKGMNVAVYHVAGNGWHLHLQAAKRPVIIKSGDSTIVI